MLSDGRREWSLEPIAWDVGERDRLKVLGIAYRFQRPSAALSADALSHSGASVSFMRACCMC